MEIIDAEGQVMGRVASIVAKLLTVGESVTVVNSEKSIVSGKPKITFTIYAERLSKGDVLHGPFYPRQSNLIFRNAIKGMLPKSPRGREALRRLKVYNDNPTGKQGKKAVKGERNLRSRYVTLKEISRSIGGKE